MSGQVYDDVFYDERFAGSSRSASVILGHVFPILKPRSVGDFGCGRGAWLGAAGSLGAERLFGFDGPWVDRDKLADPRIEFTPIDFRGDIAFSEKLDLAISVEVAEHLSEDRADWFVETLCRASDVVVFGAAVPGQGGVEHVNEQWPGYWIERFRARGFVAVDFFRARTWDDARVDWWYRQNTFLFVNGDSGQAGRYGEPIPGSHAMLSVVHPDLLAYRCRQRQQFWNQINKPTIGDCANVLASFAKKQIKRLIGRA